MTADKRTKPIFAALDELERLRDSWSRSNEEILPDAFWRECDNLIIALVDALDADGKIPSGLKMLYAAGERFAEALRYALTKEGPDGRLRIKTPWGPGQIFWEALEELFAARDGAVAPPQPPKPPEPVSVLVEQGVTFAQIAKIYGDRNEDGSYEGPFYDRFGVLRRDLIQREADEPGSVINPDDFTPAEPETRQIVRLDALFNENLRIRRRKREQQAASA